MRRGGPGQVTSRPIVNEMKDHEIIERRNPGESSEVKKFRMSEESSVSEDNCIYTVPHSLR